MSYKEFIYKTKWYQILVGVRVVKEVDGVYLEDATLYYIQAVSQKNLWVVGLSCLLFLA